MPSTLSGSAGFPVMWWVFWFVAAFVVYAGLGWWMLRQALHEDREIEQHSPTNTTEDSLR